METTATKTKTKSAQPADKNTAPATEEKKQMYVFFSGPYSDGGGSNDGIERPYWLIKLADDLLSDGKYSYRVRVYDAACRLAAKIAVDQQVEIISDAVSA